jgi:rhodanese-related sulfurtransferase
MPVVIDVREPYEFASGHVSGALNIPPSQLMTGAAALLDVPKDAQIIVYCRTGSRSAVSMNILQRMGYSNVVNGINMDHVNAHLANK